MMNKRNRDESSSGDQIILYTHFKMKFLIQKEKRKRPHLYVIPFPFHSFLFLKINSFLQYNALITDTITYKSHFNKSNVP